MACSAVKSGPANACVLKIDALEYGVQRDVRVAAREPRESGNCKSEKGRQGVAGEGGESNVEPNNVGIVFANRAEQAQRIRHGIEAPAALDGKSLEFILVISFIGENDEVDLRIVLERTGQMIAVFVEIAAAGREGSDQQDFHTTTSGGLGLRRGMLT